MNTAQTPRPKLRNPFPAIDFEQAYALLKKLVATFPHKTTFERAELVEGIGYNTNNPVGDNAVGSLAHYNLLTRIDAYQIGEKGPSKYQITSDAIKLVSAENDGDLWQTLAIDHAMWPDAFEYIFHKYGGDPPHSLSKELMLEFKNINEKNVKKIIERYVRSIEFASRSLLSVDEDVNLTQKHNNPDMGDTKREDVLVFDIGGGIKISLTKAKHAEILKRYLSQL